MIPHGKNLMKKHLIILLASVAMIQTVKGVMYTPNPVDLYDLDHFKWYTWRITDTDVRNKLKAGEAILSATLKLNNVHNWTVEDNVLHMWLLDTVSWSGVHVGTDGQGLGDHFATWATPKVNIDHWEDPNGDVNGIPTVLHPLVYAFNATQLTALEDFFKNDGKVGFGFDPDCHYWNTGISFELNTGQKPQQQVPDSGTTAFLLTFGLIGLATLRRNLKT